MLSRALEDDILLLLASFLFSSMLIFLFFGSALVLLLDGVDAAGGDGPTADGPMAVDGPRLSAVFSIPDGKTAGWV